MYDEIIARCIVGAKIASDFGKKRKSPIVELYPAGYKYGDNPYFHKSRLISKAIFYIKNSVDSDFRFYVTRDPVKHYHYKKCEDGVYRPDISQGYIIYFIHKPTKIQIGFHSFSNWEKYLSQTKYKMRWNKKKENHDLVVLLIAGYIGVTNK